MLRRPWTSSFSWVKAVALTATSGRRSARRVAVTTISSRLVTADGVSPSAAWALPRNARPHTAPRAIVVSRNDRPHPPQLDGICLPFFKVPHTYGDARLASMVEVAKHRKIKDANEHFLTIGLN